VRQIQGTLNGLGERCGNANLTTLIPTLILKEPYKSAYRNRRLDREPQAPYPRLAPSRRHPEPRAAP
jgi:2-isopropylmalate synthase